MAEIKDFAEFILLALGAATLLSVIFGENGLWGYIFRKD